MLTDRTTNPYLTNTVIHKQNNKTSVEGAFQGCKHANPSGFRANTFHIRLVFHELFIHLLLTSWNIFIKCKSCERMRVKSKFTQDWTLIKLAGHEPPRGCGYVVRSIRIVCANISCSESSYQCLFVACVII